MRIGVRGLARRPALTATALALSIGIGATAAIATVTNALLFRSLPVPDPHELVVVAQLDEHTSNFPHGLSYPEYLDYRERNDVFDGLVAHHPSTLERFLNSSEPGCSHVVVLFVGAGRRILDPRAARKEAAHGTRGT